MVYFLDGCDLPVKLLNIRQNELNFVFMILKSIYSIYMYIVNIKLNLSLQNRIKFKIM